MIVNKILGNISGAETTKTVVAIPFEWFEAEKKRIAKTAEDGTEFGVALEEVVKDGDILCETDEKIYICKIAKTRAVHIEISSRKEMGRLCFELGNRHLSLKIEEDFVLIPYDEPTYLYLKKLGFNATETHEIFSDYIECKAHAASNTHSHSHSHSHNHEHHHHHSHE